VREVSEVPVGRIIRLISKALRFSKGGFNVVEVHILVADLLSLAADLTDLCRETDAGDL
jgi:hypothetical protein